MAASLATEEEILAGCIDNLPPQDTRAVQVFVSSTFTDYEVERNYLMAGAFKRLRNYCSLHGYDFQIADMRWGVRDELQDDHLTTEIVLRAIDNSRKVSKGPYFLLLSGNRYGWRPYPNVIESSEYQCLHEVAKWLGHDVELLDEWFHKDTNHVPVSYILQPITSKFPYYNDESEENQELHDKDVAEWNAVDTLLTTMLRAAAEEAHYQELLSEERKHEYFMSVTEHEVHRGILDADDPDNRTLVVMREIPDINIKDKLAKRYCDINAGERDEEVQTLLHHLRYEEIPRKLCQSNITNYTVKWDERGISRDNEEHAAYLEKFDQDVEANLKRLFEQYLDRHCQGRPMLEITKDVLHHAAFCVRKQQYMVGREDMLKEVRNKLMKIWDCTDVEGCEEGAELPEVLQKAAELQKEVEHLKQEQLVKQKDMLRNELGVHFATEDPAEEYNSSNLFTFQGRRYPSSGNRPLVIHGKSGSGKSTFMAKLQSEISKWIKKPHVKIIRFLGTSPKCMGLQRTLDSICSQIEFNYRLKGTHEMNWQQDIVTLSAHFKYLLNHIDSESKPLVLLLDSIDQLGGNGIDLPLMWIPRLLPKNVYLIVSVMTEDNSILSSLKGYIHEESLFLEMKPLPKTVAEKMIELLSHIHGHGLTPEQTEYIIANYERSQQALWLKLALAKSLTWHSYTLRSEWDLSCVTQTLLHSLLEYVELAHGQVIVSHALGYLAASPNGLTDTEMEDILSCDDEVLQDTYLYHLPGDENNIRIPPLQWQRIQQDLSMLLIERITDGKALTYLYHRQFVQVVRARYVDNDRFIPIHSALADYFLGKWSDTVKPLELFKKKKGSYPNAMRQVPSQPLMFAEGMVNYRKLDVLLTHLTLSKRYKEVWWNCFTADWMYVKTINIGIGAVLLDINLVLRQLHAEKEEDRNGYWKFAVQELIFLKELLLLRRDVLIKEPCQLPVQLLGQLLGRDLPESYSCMVNAIKAKLQEVDQPYIAPSKYCLPCPGSNVNAVLNIVAHPRGNHRDVKRFSLSRCGHYLYAVEQQKKNGDLVKVFDVRAHGSMTKFFGLKGRMVKRMFLLANDGYLMLESHAALESSSEATHKELLTSSLQWPSFLPQDAVPHAISDSGDWILFSQGPDGSVILMQTTSQKQVAITLKKKGMEEDVVEDGSSETNGMQVTAALFSPDESFVVVFTSDGHALAIQVTSGGILHRWEDKHAVDPVITSNNILLCPGTSDTTSGNLYLLDLKRGNQKELKGHAHSICLLRVSPSETRAVTATQDGSADTTREKRALIWDLKEGRLLSRCGLVASNKRLGDVYSAVEFAGSHDEFLLTCTSNGDSAISVWYIGTNSKPLAEGVLIQELIAHTNIVFFLRITNEGKTLVSAAVDNMVILWNMENVTAECTKTIEEAEDLSIVTAVKDIVAPYNSGEGVIMTTALALSGDGKTAAVGTHDGWLIFYNVSDLRQKSYQRIHKDKVEHVITSSSGKYIITATRCTQVWNPDTGECLHTLEFDSSTPACIAESSDVAVIGYCGVTCHGVIWNIVTGEQICVLNNDNGFQKVAISSDASVVVSNMFDSLVIYRIPSGECHMKRPYNKMAECSVIVISPDDKYAASGGLDGSVKVHTIKDEKYIYHMHHKSAISEATFSPSSEHLLTAGYHAINIWSMKNGDLAHTLIYHEAPVTKLIFACADRFLVSASHDKTIVVIDYHSKVRITTFSTNSPVRDIGVASDLSSIIFAPENIAYLGVLHPNRSLCNIRDSGGLEVSKLMQDAQAVAFALSPQRIKTSTSRMCTLL